MAQIDPLRPPSGYTPQGGEWGDGVYYDASSGAGERGAVKFEKLASGGVSQLDSDLVPVSDGEAYIAKGIVRVEDSTIDPYLQVRWYLSNGASLAGVDTIPTGLGTKFNGLQWTPIGFWADPPTSSRFARLRIGYSGSPSTGDLLSWAYADLVPAPHHYEVGITSNVVLTGSAAWRDITWNGTGTLGGMIQDPSRDYVQIVRGGLYTVSARLRFTPNSGGDTLLLRCLKNGSNLTHGQSIMSATGSSGLNFITLQWAGVLEPGDRLSIDARLPAGTISSGDSNTSFSVVEHLPR